MNKKILYKRLLSYVKPHWRIFALAIFAMVVTALTEPAIPALLKPLLDDGFVAQNTDIVKMIPLILIALALVRGVATFISQVGMTWVASRVVMDLRQQMFARLLTLPTQDFDNSSSGALLSKITYDVNRVMLAATDALIILVRDSLSVLGLLAWMLYLNWQLTLLLFIIIPFIVVVVRISGKRMRNNNLSMQNAMGNLTRILEEAISGHKLVKIFSGQRYEQKRFNQSSDAVRGHEVTIKIISHLSIFAVQMLTAGALAFIIYTAAAQSAEGALSVGSFISLFAAMGMLFAPIKRLTKVNEQIQQGLAAAQTVFELIDLIPEQDQGKQKIATLRGEIQFHHLDFTYAAAQNAVLQQIDLHIQAGETIALVGLSGSGKTTLVNLIPRFYAVPAGMLSIDGIDINAMPLAELRANLAMVSQDVVLFNDSVAANIAYGIDNVSEEQMHAAAKAAHALEFINKMPEGLQTQIGERGAKLSGGQRQRLAIARALLKNAPILILDEATSALDSESEKHVQAALENLQKGRTTLLIAHRLSTVEKADRIIVLEQGKIKEMGSHVDLLEKNGRYAKLYQAQKL